MIHREMFICANEAKSTETAENDRTSPNSHEDENVLNVSDNYLMLLEWHITQIFWDLYKLIRSISSSLGRSDVYIFRKTLQRKKSFLK